MTVKSPYVDSQLIAHRGASQLVPENTLRAISQAAEMGARWIETDVQLTLDGELVIIHDHTLQRTSNGEGFVAKQTLAEIQALDAGSWFGNSEYSNLHIPTLEEFVKCVGQLGVNLQVELKELPGRERELADAVCTQMKRLWAGSSRRLLLSGFSERCLKRVEQNWSDVPRALALVYVPRDPDVLSKETGARIFQVQDKFVDEEALATIRNCNVEFGVATVNDPERAKYLLKSGVQSILTDNPALFSQMSKTKIPHVAA